MKRSFFDSGYLMIAAGSAGIVIAIFANTLGIGNSGFGLEQLAGVILGLFTFAAGLLKFYPFNKTIIARILAGIYVRGIIFMGLIPRHFNGGQAQLFWHAPTILSRDFFINPIGFVLIGYLFMLSALIKNGGKRLGYLFKKALLLVLAGAALSSFLELAHYYFIRGRVAGSADVIANTFGTVVGVLLFAFRLPFRQNATSKVVL